MKKWKNTVFCQKITILCLLVLRHIRGVINGKAAALPKFLGTLTLSQPGMADYVHPLALPHQKIFCDYTPAYGAYGPQGIKLIKQIGKNTGSYFVIFIIF